MIRSPFRERCRRTFWPFLLGCLLGALLLAVASHGLPSAWAEVRATPQREAFKSGGERSETAIREVIDLLGSGVFSGGDRDLFQPLNESLLTRDGYMLFADYESYVDCQARVSEAYTRPQDWTRMAILNTARVGGFSSDRSIREYCRHIWGVQPLAGRGGR